MQTNFYRKLSLFLKLNQYASYNAKELRRNLKFSHITSKIQPLVKEYKDLLTNKNLTLLKDRHTPMFVIYFLIKKNIIPQGINLRLNLFYSRLGQLEKEELNYKITKKGWQIIDDNNEVYPDIECNIGLLNELKLHKEKNTFLLPLQKRALAIGKNYTHLDYLKDFDSQWRAINEAVCIHGEGCKDEVCQTEHNKRKEESLNEHCLEFLNDLYSDETLLLDMLNECIAQQNLNPLITLFTLPHKDHFFIQTLMAYLSKEVCKQFFERLVQEEQLINFINQLPALGYYLFLHCGIEVILDKLQDLESETINQLIEWTDIKGQNFFHLLLTHDSLDETLDTVLLSKFIAKSSTEIRTKALLHKAKDGINPLELTDTTLNLDVEYQIFKVLLHSMNTSQLIAIFSGAGQKQYMMADYLLSIVAPEQLRKLIYKGPRDELKKALLEEDSDSCPTIFALIEEESLEIALKKLAIIKSVYNEEEFQTLLNLTFVDLDVTLFEFWANKNECSIDEIKKIFDAICDELSMKGFSIYYGFFAQYANNPQPEDTLYEEETILKLCEQLEDDEEEEKHGLSTAKKRKRDIENDLPPAKRVYNFMKEPSPNGEEENKDSTGAMHYNYSNLN